MRAALCAWAVLAGAAAPALAGDDGGDVPGVIVLRLDVGQGVMAGLGERIQLEVEYRARRSGLPALEGEANLADTAAVAGCTSKVAAQCLDAIISTLGVSELIYGSVERTMGGHRVSVSRARAGAKPLEVVVDVPASSVDAAARAASPVLDDLFPVVTGTAPLDAGPPVNGGTGGAALPGSAEVRDQPPRSAAAIRRDRLIGITGLAVGGVAVLAGGALWIKASALQTEIDDAPNDTAEEVAALRDLENSAISYATWGNGLVIGGVVVAAVGAIWWGVRGRRRDAGPVVGAWLGPDGGGAVVTWSAP